MTAPNDFAIFYTHEDNELLSVKLPIEQGAIVFFIMQHICQQIPGFLRPNIDILENAYNAESTKALQQFKDFLNPTHPVHLDYITPPNFDALVTTEKPRLTLKSPTAASYPTIQSLANLSKSEPSSSYMEPSFSAT
ncbi:MAG: hypothetical protein HWD59_09870 [Coxiellaceae bacterium]|nr:MAG: hypothetical protein HWD59_09870 [Coxiellaceae bacterium]